MPGLSSSEHPWNFLDVGLSCSRPVRATFLVGTTSKNRAVYLKPHPSPSKSTNAPRASENKPVAARRPVSSSATPQTAPLCPTKVPIQLPVDPFRIMGVLAINHENKGNTVCTDVHTVSDTSQYSAQGIMSIFHLSQRCSTAQYSTVRVEGFACSARSNPASKIHGNFSISKTTTTDSTTHMCVRVAMSHWIDMHY